MGITTTIPTNLNFPNRGILERDAFVLAQETAQDLLAGGYTTALNQYAVELNATQMDINTKAEQVANQAVTGSYSQAYIDATFTPKILNTQTAKTTPVDADLIPLSDSASSFVLKKLSWANLKATLISSFGALISGLTAKTTVVANDLIVIADSASANASKKVTFASLKTYVTPAAASETASGIIELATTAEAQAGTDDARAITPLKLRNALNANGDAPIYACRAWVNFNGTETIAIRASGNVSSITDDGVGMYTMNFATAMPDANYSMGGINRQDYNTASIGIVGIRYQTTLLATSFSFKTGIDSGVPYDMTYVTLQVFR